MSPSTVSATALSDRQSPRDKLLAAARELFYEEGFNGVGIDRVIERAGVAKASLYSNFGSKDELIRAYLASRQEARQAHLMQKLAHYTTPRTRLLGVFDVMGELFAESGFRGCAFVKASAEVRPDSAARGVCDDYRLWIRTLFTDLAREAGAAKPDVLARQLVLLYDGASIAAQMDGDAQAAKAARAMAAQMLDAATGK